MNNASSHNADRNVSRSSTGGGASSHNAASRIRVTLCTTELSVGGAEQALVELATRLDRQRFEVQVVSLAASPDYPRDRLVRCLREASIETHFLGGTSLASGPGTLWKLYRRLRRWPTDVLQTFLFHANVMGPVAAKLAGVTHVVTGIRVAERNRRWRWRLEAATSRMVDRHVCVSRAVEGFARDDIGLSQQQLVVIPNGVDSLCFTGASPADLVSLGIARERRVMVFIGRLDRQKGTDRLMDAAPKLLEQLPEHDLLLVGDGPERSRIEAFVTQHNLTRRVHLVGWQDNVPGILAASELLLLPSRWEGMPNVVLEAMASGLGVVAMDVEGVREVLGDAADDQVVPQGDTKAFAQRVIALLNDPDRTALLGDRNRARVAEQFDWQRSVEQYAALYESLLAASAR